MTHPLPCLSPDGGYTQCPAKDERCDNCAIPEHDTDTWAHDNAERLSRETASSYGLWHADLSKIANHPHRDAVLDVARQFGRPIAYRVATYSMIDLTADERDDVEDGAAEAALSRALVDPGLARALDSLDADLFPPDPYDAALATARAGCCGERRKPCPYHEGWADGYETCQRDAAERATPHDAGMAAWVAENIGDVP